MTEHAAAGRSHAPILDMVALGEDFKGTPVGGVKLRVADAMCPARLATQSKASTAIGSCGCSSASSRTRVANDRPGRRALCHLPINPGIPARPESTRLLHVSAAALYSLSKAS